ncbi:MAG: hypothetical protein WAL95_10740 [Candidatus Acidiferrales bacterium]
MAPIGLALTSVIPGGSAALDSTDAGGVAPSQVVYHVPPASQAPAAPSDGRRQDTVTLSGMAPASRNQGASQNFVPTAAFTLLAHEFTFPPNDSENVASAPGATSSRSATALADQAAVTEEPPPAPTLTPGSVNATSVAVAAVAVQPATSASAAANTASSAAGGTPAAAPQETLQQLDQELQRLGINPQDISLLNRMSLLPWVNDPVALRQFVQGTEPSAVASKKIPAANSLDTQTSAVQFGAGGSANASEGAAAAIQSGALSQAENQSAITTSNESQVSVLGANQNSGAAQSSGISNSGPAGSPNQPQWQTAAAVLRLEKLQASLVAASQDAQVSALGKGIAPAQGQFVNISA